MLLLPLMFVYIDFAKHYKLQNFINEAKKQGINADFSPYEALLAKDGVTYKELQDAINKISPAVELGKAITKAKEFDGSRSWEKFEKIHLQ